MEPVSNSLITSQTLSIENVKEAFTSHAIAQTLSVKNLDDLLSLPTLWQVALRLAPAVGAGIATWVVLYYGRYFLIKWLSRHQEQQVVTGVRRWVLRIAQHTRTWFIGLQALAATLALLPIPTQMLSLIGHISAILTFIQMGIWANVIFKELGQNHLESHPGDGARATTVHTVLMLTTILVWALVLLAVLDNIGVNINAMVAGLGIGGVALAFAAQNILSNMFASIGLIFDSPYLLGDFITTGSTTGTVEHMGLRMTRIRALSGEQVTIPNSDIMSSRIQNFSRLKERRVVFSFGVEYSTSTELLEQIPAMVKQAIESHENVRFDRSHFAKFGDSSLLFETVYFVTKSEYNLMMDIQQKVNLTLMNEFRAKGIEFAFPSRTIYHRYADSGSPSEAE